MLLLQRLKQVLERPPRGLASIQIYADTALWQGQLQQAPRDEASLLTFACLIQRRDF